MNKIRRAWKLMCECWRVLLQDKGLLLFPLISGICCLLLLASFALPLIFTHHWQPPVGAASGASQIAYYGVLFLFYLCNYFIIIFFNAAMVACATIRMTGGNPTVGDGFRAAAARLPLIAGWALISATVGLILRLIEDRSKWVGRIVASLLGTAWTVVSFLVVPILVVENKNPLAALQESTALVKKTWGEQVAGNFGLGLMTFLLTIPGIAIMGLGFFSGNGAVIIASIVVGAIYLIILSLVTSTVRSIFQAAVFLYARDGRVPEGFDPEILGNAMIRR